jgi:hypothetical protein
MAWLRKRRAERQSKWNFFRWLLGHEAPKSAGNRNPEKRRAHRVDLRVPVFLYGSMNGEPFSEISKTLDVCVKGALVSVNLRVIPYQRLLLTNLQTERDLKCRVVRVDTHRRAIALEFLEPCPDFWCVDFVSPSE